MRFALSVNAKLSFCMILSLISLKSQLLCMHFFVAISFALSGNISRRLFDFIFIVLIQGLVTDLSQARTRDECAENKCCQLAGVTFKDFWTCNRAARSFFRSACHTAQRTNDHARNKQLNNIECNHSRQHTISYILSLAPHRDYMLLPFRRCAQSCLPVVLYETMVDVTQFYRIYLENYSNIFDH